MTDTFCTEQRLRDLLADDAQDVCDGATLLARLRRDHPAAAVARGAAQPPTGSDRGNLEITDPHAGSRYRSRLARWAPLAVAAVVAVALSITVALVRSGQTPAAKQNRLGDLVGISWDLRTVNGTSVSGDWVTIEPNGRFAQSLPGCGPQLQGHLSITADQLAVTRVQLENTGKSCPLSAGSVVQPKNAAPPAVLRALWSGTLTWDVRGATLTLRSNGITARYSRWSFSPTYTRQWTYRGLGISLPANWHTDVLRCDAPITDTVLIIGGPTVHCATPRRRISLVQFGPYNPGSDPFPTPPLIGEGWYVDGAVADYRETGLDQTPQLAELRLRTLDVSIVIFAPSQDEVQKLARQIYLVNGR